MGGNTSFVFGDFYMPEHGNPTTDLIGISLDGALHLHLPSGQKLKLGKQWLVYIPLSALGEAVAGTVLQARASRRKSPPLAASRRHDVVIDGPLGEVVVKPPGLDDVPF